MIGPGPRNGLHTDYTLILDGRRRPQYQFGSSSSEFRESSYWKVLVVEALVAEQNTSSLNGTWV